MRFIEIDRQHEFQCDAVGTVTHRGAPHGYAHHIELPSKIDRSRSYIYGYLSARRDREENGLQGFGGRTAN